MRADTILASIALFMSSLTLFLVYLFVSGSTTREKAPTTLSPTMDIITEEEVSNLIQQSMNKKIGDLKTEILNQLKEEQTSVQEKLRKTPFAVVDWTPEMITMLIQSEHFDKLLRAMYENTDKSYAFVLQEKMNSLLLAKMAEEIEKLDWADVLEKEKLQKLLTQAAQSSPFSIGNMSRIDVSDTPEVEEKIKIILNAIAENPRGFFPDGPIIEQLVEMGEDAIQPLLSELVQVRKLMSREDHTKRRAIENALSRVLNEKHKDLILHNFKEYDVCANLIKKYLFPEAEEIVLAKLRAPDRFMKRDIIDIALLLNEEKAIPLLIDQIQNGDRYAYYAAQKLATIPNLDLNEPLRKAALRVHSVYEKAEFSKIMLERGMKEGLDLAITIMRSDAFNQNDIKDQMADALRMYTAVRGGYDEMADWLELNKNTIVWDEVTRKFR